MTQRAKKLWLEIYRLYGIEKQACEIVGREGVPLHMSTVRRWVKDDADFRLERREIGSMWRFIVAGELASLTKQSVDVVRHNLTQRDDMRLAFQTAKWQLKSQGLDRPTGVQPVQKEEKGGSVPITIKEIVLNRPRPKEITTPIIKGESRPLDGNEAT